MNKHPLAAAAVALTLVACSSGDDDSADLDIATTAASPTTATQSAATVPAKPTAPSREATETTDAAVSSLVNTVASQPSDEQPIATWEGDTGLLDGSDNPVRGRFELLELSRSGDVATLRFAFTPVDADDEYDPSDDFSEEASTDFYTVSGVNLLDLTNGNKHLTLEDDQGKCLCSIMANRGIQPDQRLELYAQFAAPPADVTTASVVIPGAPPFEQVPITEGG